MRYDPERQVYRDCRWCGGKGCLSCPIEAEKAYKREFPDGPKPIATFTREDVDAGKLKAVLGPEAIESATAEARRRAAEKLASLGGFRALIDGTDEEAIEAMTAQLTGEVLTERIMAAAGSSA